MNEVTELPPLDAGDIIEQVITKGDLGKLTAQERVTYYRDVCESLGLNPLTRPFEYITLQGKLVLYARRDCADQLRKLHRISVEILSQRTDGELYIVQARARAPSGRTDEDMGAVTIGRMTGEMRANAVLKCVTKAKRRVTLSICGLGFLDETEVNDDVVGAEPANTAALLDQFAAEQPPEETLLQQAQRIALRGSDAYRDYWVSLTNAQRRELMPHHDSLKEAAERADEDPDAIGR